MSAKKPVLKIAVIGAGPAGLAAAKNSIEQGHNVIIFEQNEDLGRVWAYEEKIGKDEYGINIHTSMYEGLRANAPYQLMEFPNFKYPSDTRGFPSQVDVLKYFHSSANHFDLEKQIKYRHAVIRVHPIENDRWEVILKDLRNNKFITEIYDAVFACNGRFFNPKIPTFVGANGFRGRVLHSHDVRKFEDFLGEKVLIIGAGISGVELVILLSGIAKEITLSRSKNPDETPEALQKFHSTLPTETILKDNVKRILVEGAEFIDGSKQTFTVIVYATGFKMSYSFLSVETGIYVDDNFVKPLYKHLINIEHPTMAFIGVVVVGPLYLLYDNRPNLL